MPDSDQLNSEQPDSEQPNFEMRSAIAATPLSPAMAFEDAPDRGQLLLLMNQNAKLLDDVLVLMITEARRLGKAFVAAVEANEPSAARRAVHTLKSNARQLGLSCIADYAEQIEKLARPLTCTDSLQPFKSSIAQLSEAMAEWAACMHQQQ